MELNFCLIKTSKNLLPSFNNRKNKKLQVNILKKIERTQLQLVHLHLITKKPKFNLLLWNRNNTKNLMKMKKELFFKKLNQKLVKVNTFKLMKKSSMVRQIKMIKKLILCLTFMITRWRLRRVRKMIPFISRFKMKTKIWEAFINIATYI